MHETAPETTLETQFSWVNTLFLSLTPPLAAILLWFYVRSEGVAASDVATQIGMSPGAIYVAKSRVLARLKEEVETLRQQEDG